MFSTKPATTFSDPLTVLQAANHNRGAKVLVVGYSPTGGGHTGRLLNIIGHALEKGAFTSGCVVIFHVPPVWENIPRRAELDVLCRKLLQKGIAVVLAEATRPVYGYLDDKTGGSNDAMILERLACYPLRNRMKPQGNSCVDGLEQCVIYQPGMDIHSLPVIESKVLFSSLLRVLSRETLFNRVYVLTDMDFALQKAAACIGIPGHHRLDQQNHAILLETIHTQINFLPKYALLAKVLGGTGEKISHIAPGEKNTLGSMIDTAARLQINAGIPVAVAQERIMKEIEKHLLSANAAAAKLQNCLKTGAAFVGAICSENVTRDYSKKNIVYIYAHKKTNSIAQHIQTRLAQNHPDYSCRVFIFCGSGATGNLNTLHLCYLADADGITTAGAGTCGEFRYLHRQVACQARLLVLPVEGHNEQAANLAYLSTSEATKEYIYSMRAQENLQQLLDRYLSIAPVAIDKKQTMSDYFHAITCEKTYAAQAFELLFNQVSPSQQITFLQQLEVNMYQSPLLKGTRRYLKMVFQGMLLAEKGRQDAVDIWFSDKEINSHRFDNLWDLGMTIGNNTLLANVLGLQKEEVAGLPLRLQIASFFKQVGKRWSSNSLIEMNKLKEELGEFMITGF